MIEEVLKKVDKINEGCGIRLGEDFEDLCCREDFDNEESPSGGSFILCQKCREHLFRAKGIIEGYRKAQDIQDEKVKKLKKEIKYLPEWKTFYKRNKKVAELIVDKEIEAMYNGKIKNSILFPYGEYVLKETKKKIDKIFAKQDDGEKDE